MEMNVRTQVKQCLTLREFLSSVSLLVIVSWIDASRRFFVVKAKPVNVAKTEERGSGIKLAQYNATCQRKERGHEHQNVCECKVNIGLPFSCLCQTVALQTLVANR